MKRESDYYLSELRPFLEKCGFNVETGKKRSEMQQLKSKRKLDSRVFNFDAIRVNDTGLYVVEVGGGIEKNDGAAQTAYHNLFKALNVGANGLIYLVPNGGPSKRPNNKGVAYEAARVAFNDAEYHGLLRAIRVYLYEFDEQNFKLLRQTGWY